jgi:hypothetical protein
VPTVDSGALAGASARAANRSASHAAALTSSPSNGGSLFGVRVPAEVEQGVLLATLTLICGMLVVALVIGDAAGVGPRHGMWSARWSERLGRH